MTSPCTPASRGPQFPHRHKEELDLETPMPSYLLNRRESDQQALSGVPEQLRPGRELSSAPGPRLGRSTQALGLSPRQWWRLGPDSGREPPGNGSHASSAAQPAPLGDLGLSSRRWPRLRPARCDPAAGHSPSSSPGARPRPGERAAVSSSSSSAPAAPGQLRPATPMEGAAAGRGDGARASTVEAPGGVCRRPA